MCSKAGALEQGKSSCFGVCIEPLIFCMCSKSGDLEQGESFTLCAFIFQLFYSSTPTPLYPF